MSSADGSVAGVTKLIENGSGSERWDLVLLGDGFRGEDLPGYHRDVARFVERFLATPPFAELQSAINIHRIDVVSNESGAGDELTGTKRKTYFDSHFGENGLDRLLVTNTTLALRTATRVVPAMNAALMLVNSERHGGSGGAVPVFSRYEEGPNTAIHEMGHSYFGLADEYAFYSDCSDPGRARYDGTEPDEPNVTGSLVPLKWAQLVTPGAALPTMPNPDCDDCNPRPSPVAPGTTGAFEGARYFRCGLYRPAFACRMRNVTDPFCAVCRDAIVRVLEPYRPKAGRRRSVRK